MKLNKLLKFLLVFIFAISLFELSLRLVGYIIIQSQVKHGRNKELIQSSRVVNVMFIGDSWTQGADALPGKGYAETLIKLLNQKLSSQGLQFQGVNDARGSFNSSEASFVFLGDYKRINPLFLFVLIGINNTWNSQDVALTDKFFERELNFNTKTDKQIGLNDKIFIQINKLKIVKLLKLVYFNLFTKNQQLFGPHPASVYRTRFFEFHAAGQVEKARSYLIDNMDKFSNYDDFYRMMLYSFGYNSTYVNDYLEKKGVYHPELITHKFYQEDHDILIKKRYQLLERNIGYLKKICDTRHITIVLQDYPYYGNPNVCELNNELSQIARKFGIHFVSHYRYF